MDIQWYPGHMAKATRLMKEELKKVDIVIMMGDARAVRKSINHDFFDVIRNKKHIMVFNKSDLSDPDENQKWKEYFKESENTVFFIDCLNKKGLGELTSYLKNLKNNFRFDREVRVMVTGIPNVGKSMFINTLAKRNAAQAGNKPGVTRAKQWIRVGNDFYLLDTPGVLPPKFETEEEGMVLASIGSVKDTIFDREELALKIVSFLIERYPGKLSERYKLDLSEHEDSLSVFEQIAENRGFKMKGGLYDYERTATMILEEFRNGTIGTISFDTVDKEEVTNK